MMSVLFMMCGMPLIVLAVLLVWYWLEEGRHEKQKPPLRKWSEWDNQALEDAFWADQDQGWGDR